VHREWGVRVISFKGSNSDIRNVRCFSSFDQEFILSYVSFIKSKTIQKLFLCYAVLLGSCQNIHQEHEVASPSVASEKFKSSTQNTVQNTLPITDMQANDFSTTGKQTKSYNTPNGTIWLYDIAQDPEVSQAIDELYARGDVTFSDVSFRYPYNADNYSIDDREYFSPDVDVRPAVILLTKARQISQYDLYRSSCKIVERAPCGDGYSGWGPRYVSDCPSCNLGKVPDYSVETIRRNYNRVVEKILTEEDIPKGRLPVSPNGQYSTAVVDECRDISKQPLLKYYYIGERSGYSLAETKTLLLHSDCSEWK